MKLLKVKKIVGNRIVLRRLRLNDVPSIVKYAKDKSVARYLDSLPHPYKSKDARKWIFRSWKGKDNYIFGITLKGEDNVVGAIGLHRVEKKSDFKIAEIGYWLGRRYWNKGYVTEAASLLLDFAFKKLKLKRVYSRVFEPNIASQKILRKLGFKEEGRLREHHKYRFGKGWLDEFYFGMLREEWRK